jgi:hypothetical protein
MKGPESNADYIPMRVRTTLHFSRQSPALALNASIYMCNRERRSDPEVYPVYVSITPGRQKFIKSTPRLDSRQIKSGHGLSL